MRTLTIIYGCLLAVSAVLANPVPSNISLADDVERVPISFEDVIVTGLGTRGFSGTWISGTRLMYRDSGTIKVYTVGSEIVDNVLTTADMANIQASAYSLSPSWNKMLIRYDDRSIFRHSIVAKYAIIDIQNIGQATPIANANELSTCAWASQTDKLAFVRNNNVYVRTEAGVERQLTTDGVTGTVYNGVADWVYEEEILASSRALWFSPDGTKLAIVKFVDTDVQEYTYFEYGTPGNIEDQYPEAIKLRYPKSGTVNPTVTVQVIDTEDTEATWKVISPPAALVNTEPIIGAVTWSTADTIVTFWMNRRQNIGIVQQCSFETMECEDIVRFEQADGWVSNGTPQCTSDGAECLMIAPDNNWFKAVKINMQEKTVTPLTPDRVTVQSIYSYNQAQDVVYYLGVPFDHPERRGVYRNSECLSCSVVGPLEEPCNYASASFSTNNQYYTLICSGPSPSFTLTLQTSTNAVVKRWEDNLAAREKLTTRQEPKVHFLTAEVEGGFQATIRMKVPAELDIEAETFDKKYPMIVTVYGGPNSVRVVDSFSFAYQDYLVSSRKVIEVSIDGRGSANKGVDLLFTLNNKLGTVEIEDQIAVAKFLQGKYSFIDPERSGIWGWSYGGYATAMALSKDTERVFQCGISVAPVTSWIYYDSMYTERYMGTPLVNGANYNASDVTQHLEQFKYHDFLLVHGNADDNVHYQQAMALSRALQQENIMFEQMSYPDEAHGLNGVSRHLYHTMDQFWEKCLSWDD